MKIKCEKKENIPNATPTYPWVGRYKSYNDGLRYLFISKNKAICISSDAPQDVLIDGVEDVYEEFYTPVYGTFIIKIIT